MNKLVIGFIGEHNVGKTTAANIFKKQGFHKLSINSKVEEVAKYLFSKDELKQNTHSILNEVRRRGVKVCKEYWLNLMLVTVPEDKKHVVFDDFSIAEVEIKNVKTIQIVRPGVTTVELPDVETIINDGNLNNFVQKIEELYRKLTK